ncbi:chemotaxis signal transduction protein [Leptolyngbya sp. PCC 7375]|nr:chemotaxis signal transduction protein [Leptolyngbya sp. PCC 7375]
MQLSTQTLSQASAVDQYLKFSLLNDVTALLPISQLAAALKIEVSQITAIPHLPPWIMGVYNWRGEILWLVDIGHLLGGNPLHQQPTLTTHYNTLLLEKSSIETPERYHLGLVVHQIKGIELFSLDTIQSPSVISETLVPFLRGYWLGEAGEMLILLEGLSIFDHMPV